MRFYIRVKTGCSEQSIEEFGDHRYVVHLKCEPYHSKANIELINMFAKHVGVPALKLKIISGLTNKDKVLEIV